MKVYVFGNEDVAEDNLVFKVLQKLKEKTSDIQFIIVKPNEDLPFTEKQHVVILDTVLGINKVSLIEDQDIEKLVLPPRNSVHDFDLSFQIKYLKKLGKLGKITLIGLPPTGNIDYLRIQSIFKKLVAQDMQGS